MNEKSMLVGFLIAVVASTGAYFLVPPPSGAEASNCATPHEIKNILRNCEFPAGGEHFEYHLPIC